MEFVSSVFCTEMPSTNLYLQIMA